MAKKRIVIADTNREYILAIQACFVEEFYSKSKSEDVDIELITDQDYYNRLFAIPQKIDVLVISEELYSQNLQKHDITYIFQMMECCEESNKAIKNVHCIQKYSSFKEIMSQIIAVSGEIDDKKKDESKIITVYSASGGTGKTSLAIGLAVALVKNYKKVLYINASWLHSFQIFLEDKKAINDPNVYSRLSKESESIYGDIKHILREELFTYIPPFKAALISLGINYSIYRKIALSAKASKDFDYIILDADTEFNKEKADMIEDSDKVIIVMTQCASSVNATNMLVSNINGIDNDKYVFACNDFRTDEDNALISGESKTRFQVNIFIEHMNRLKDMKLSDWASVDGIKKLSLLLI